MNYLIIYIESYKKFIDYSSKFFIGKPKFQNIEDIPIKQQMRFLDNTKYGL